MQAPLEMSKKVCMLGSFGVGKTSLVRRFVYSCFDEKYLTTIGVQISYKQLEPIARSSTKTLVQPKLILWDLAHIEKLNEVIKNYFRGAHGAIIVLDLLRPQTFSDIDFYLKSFFAMNHQSQIIIVGNKYDAVDPDGKNVELFLRSVESYKLRHFCTSAKSGQNVDKMFNTLGSMIIEAS